MAHTISSVPNVSLTTATVMPRGSSRQPAVSSAVNATVTHKRIFK
jgi:hypothetical protein